MGKIIEKIKNIFCGKFTCKPEEKQEVAPPQEEVKKEEKPEEQK